MWWNSSYKFRRKIRISANYGFVAASTILLFPFNTSNILSLGKVRSDYQDIEVIHHLPNGIDFVVLPSSVDDTNVNFMVDEDLHSDNVSEGEYFVYYGNPNLLNIFSGGPDNTGMLSPTRVIAKIPVPTVLTNTPNNALTAPLILSPLRIGAKINNPYVIKPIQVNSFSDNFWSSQIMPWSNKIAYTKPGVQWISGNGLAVDARATLTFSSDRIRMISTTSNNQGIVSIKVDDEPWEMIDLFSSLAYQEVISFIRTDLEPKQHVLQLLVTGDKSSDSVGFSVNFARFESLDVAKLENLGEEINPDLVWTSVYGGAI